MPYFQHHPLLLPVIHPILQLSLTTSQLGIPTANIPPSGLAAYPSLSSGVYYGYVGLLHSSAEIFPAVLSIGYNPFYANTTRSIEIHILHEFHQDFYDASLNLLMLGYIRPEYDYVSKESLVEDIKIDCDVARRSLERNAYQKYQEEAWLRDFTWKDSIDVEKVEREVLNKDGEAKM
jgi:riboflavin kinase